MGGLLRLFEWGRGPSEGKKPINKIQRNHKIFRRKLWQRFLVWVIKGESQEIWRCPWQLNV
jgi:hypothetical protein